MRFDESQLSTCPYRIRYEIFYDISSSLDLFVEAFVFIIIILIWEWREYLRYFWDEVVL